LANGALEIRFQVTERQLAFAFGRGRHFFFDFFQIFRQMLNKSRPHDRQRFHSSGRNNT
jgi:hypothetical protein